MATERLKAWTREFTVPLHDAHFLGSLELARAAMQSAQVSLQNTDDPDFVAAA